MANVLPLALLAALSSASFAAAAAETPTNSAENAAGTPAGKSADFRANAEKRREAEVRKLDPLVGASKPDAPSPFAHYPWKSGIVTTIFWVGSGKDEKTRGQPANAWDSDWGRSFGGFDDPLPAHREDFIVTGSIPRQNPFYIALPYNDIADGKTKPEAVKVIPWFSRAHVKDGQSVCQNRWVEIRSAARKVCYAQWIDCGPFRTDHWQYVFGNERPAPNANQGSGLNVSPAVRDFLGLSPTDVTDWKFVEFYEVPKGPWSLYGENNSFLQEQHIGGKLLSEMPAEPIFPIASPAPLPAVK